MTSFWKTLLVLALYLGAPMLLLAQNPAWPNSGERPASTYRTWHSESARILDRAGAFDTIRSYRDEDLVNAVLHLGDLRQFAQEDPNLGREAIQSEASRGNIAGIILLRKAGYEDPDSAEAEATAAKYWQTQDSDVIFFQTERYSRQGRNTDIHLGLRVPEIFLDSGSNRTKCGVKSDEKFSCSSKPFQFEVAFRQAWMQEFFDRLLPGSSKDKEPWVTVEENRNTREITMIGRKGATNFKLVVSGSHWAEAEVDALAEQIWAWLPKHSVSPAAPLIVWLLILLLVLGLIAIRRQKQAVKDFYDES